MDQMTSRKIMVSSVEEGEGHVSRDCDVFGDNAKKDRWRFGDTAWSVLT